MIFRLSAGNKHDAPEGRKLIESFYSEDKHYLLMDRAYEDNETRELAIKQGVLYLLFRQKETVKILGNMIRNFTSAAMKLNDIFFV